MTRRRLIDQRGTVLLFVTALLVFLLSMAGLATDISYLVSARNELRRSMDAAALAGAGKLGFDDTVFPLARSFAQQFAGLNPYRRPGGGTITLDLNPANAPSGDIVLGIWNGLTRTFTPSLDGTMVNAVSCRVSTTIPTFFLRVIGVNSLPIGASAIAVSDPPTTPPPTGCVAPIGATTCAFTNAGAFNSQGCGQPFSFISSSGGVPGTAGGTNTGAWVNLIGTGTPNAPNLNAALNAAAGGSCSGSTLGVGDPLGTNNGMIESVLNTLIDVFTAQYNLSVSTDNNGKGPFVITSTIGTYTGYGWEVFVPLIQSQPLPSQPTCPPQAISGDWYIVGWSRFVMTQVIRNQQGSLPRCVVENAADWNSAPLCTDPTLHESVRAIFGYFECSKFDVVNPITVPGPRAALAERIRLVQ